MTVKEPPTDGISNLAFNSRSILFASSWDKTVRGYDSENSMILKYSLPASVLALGTIGDVVYSGGLDRQLTAFDVQTQSISATTRHDAPISCIATLDGIVLTGGWDKVIKITDPRANSSTSLAQPDKVFSMDTTGNYAAVALAGRIVQIYDLRNTASVLSSKESSLKHMIRKVACSPDGTCYATASIEGRVAVDFFDPEAQLEKFSFKCHRIKDNDVELIYPVNALCFHPKFQKTFASGGGDGIVNIWDGNQKKRLKQLPAYQTSISALAFSPGGDRMAIAVSYTFEEGEKDHAQDSIVIRSVAESELTPKIRTR